MTLPIFCPLVPGIITFNRNTRLTAKLNGPIIECQQDLSWTGEHDPVFFVTVITGTIHSKPLFSTNLISSGFRPIEASLPETVNNPTEH